MMKYLHIATDVVVVRLHSAGLVVEGISLSRDNDKIDALGNLVPGCFVSATLGTAG